MVRDKHSAGAKDDNGAIMTEREEQLRQLGVGLPSTAEADLHALSLEPNGFSGYGEFTPISIRSYSLPEPHADLERDKPRD